MFDANKDRIQLNSAEAIGGLHNQNDKDSISIYLQINTRIKNNSFDWDVSH